MTYLEALQQAIRRMHGCESVHVESAPVREEHDGKVVWQGTVEVFDLIEYPQAKRCYAWAHDENGGSRYVAVLSVPPIDTPEKAVRAAIVNEARNRLLGDSQRLADEARGRQGQ